MKKSLFIFDFLKFSWRLFARKLFVISKMCKFKNVLFFMSFQTCFSCNFHVCTQCNFVFIVIFTWHENQMIFVIQFFWSFDCVASCDASQRRWIQFGFIQRHNNITTSSYANYWHRILWKNVNSSFYQSQNCIMKCDTQCEFTEDLDVVSHTKSEQELALFRSFDM